MAASAPDSNPDSRARCARHHRKTFSEGISHDRTQTIFKAWRRRPRLAEGKAPLLVRQPLRPRQYGPRLVAGVERRRDRAEHRLSRPSPRQHGNHHLCPRRRDHAPGQPWQQGPHRSGRRPGDERRQRHSSFRVQSGGDQDADFPDLDRARHQRRPADLGRKTVSEVGSFRQARHHRQRHCRRQRRPADPRQCAGARHHAEGRRERGIRRRHSAPPLSGAGGRQRRSQRRARQRPRRRRDPR